MFSLNFCAFFVIFIYIFCSSAAWLQE